MTPAPDRCTHSFPDPYPQPMTQLGNCRDCGISYQEAKDAMSNPAGELATAARTLRPSSPTVAAHTVAVRLHPAVIEALEELLDATAEWAREYPGMAHDHDRPACDDYACDVMGRAISLARTITGGQP